jgi:hypothetical protein
MIPTAYVHRLQRLVRAVIAPGALAALAVATLGSDLAAQAPLGAPFSLPLGAPAELVPSDKGPGLGFGGAVALDGNIAVVRRLSVPLPVGVPVVSVFEKTAGSWIERAQLSPEPGVANGFGSSIAVSGNRVVVGAAWDDDAGQNAGAVYVFQRAGNAWPLVDKLTSADAEPGDLLGWAVAIDGDRLVASALYAETEFSSPDVGAVHVFEKSGRLWQEVATIDLPTGGYGNDGFGHSLAIDGSSMVVGAPYEKVSGFDRGQGYAFQLVGGQWFWTSELASTADFSGQVHGTSIDVSGDLAVVGAPGDGPGLGYDAPGAAYVYRRSGNFWSLEAKLGPDDELFTFPEFGSSVAVDGNRVLVGSKGGGEGGVLSGSVYVFEKTRIGWAQLDEWAGVAAGDGYGASLAADGGFALVGVPGADVHGDGSGTVLVRSTKLPQPALLTSPAHLQFWQAGTSQRMRLDGGLGHAGLPFVVLGSSTGTTPPGTFLGTTVPLAFDAYTTATMSAPGTTPLVGAAGVLDENGRALCEFVIPPGGLSDTLVGMPYHHAFVVLDPAQLTVRLVSNAAPVTLVY